jgi:aspartokinase
MSRISLGGVKVVENRAYLCSSSRSEGDPLADICSIFAAGRINVGLLTYLADNGHGESITSASAKSALSFSGYTLRTAGSDNNHKTEIESDVCRISLFPHDQKPEVTASAIRVLDAGAVKPFSFASSPSAVTAVLSSSDLYAAMERIFESFDFPGCLSHEQWLAFYRMDEQQLSEVRFSYSEQIITIYGVNCQVGFDLWKVCMPIDYVRDFGTFLLQLGKLGLKLPFLISNPAPGRNGVLFSLALREDRHETIKRTLDEFLPVSSFSCRGPVSVLFVHGPHFGDRYGIADAFVTALRDGGVSLLALSCAVSSISAVIDGNHTDGAVEALGARFQTSNAKI